jgi:MFS transporter, YQGE family, putative transporter
MSRRELHPKAWVALLLSGLYHGSEALAQIFVSVYFFVNSLDFTLVCKHYLALYMVTPVVYLLASWYSAAYERLHVYRLGLVLHAGYYGALLILREESANYAVPLGILLGVTWGFFWAGQNTFNFDVTTEGRREYYLGWLQAIVGACRLVAPLLGGILIHVTRSYTGQNLLGYQFVFGLVMLIYLVCFVVSFRMPRDPGRRPFKIKRALFPAREHRDWRLIMIASASLAGSFHIFAFLLALLLYMQTKDELSVGGFASVQALVGIIVAYSLRDVITPRNRGRFLLWGSILLMASGGILLFKLSAMTIVIFGLLRAVAAPLWSIPHFGVRLDVIARSVEIPAQRIEYLSAWEVPLAFGRIVMMLTLLGLYGWLEGNDWAIRLSLFLLCSLRIVTYLIIARTSVIREHQV